MPRKVVPMITGEKYHVFNRGVDKRIIFNKKQDYIRFYKCLSLFNSKSPIQDFSRAETNQSKIDDRLVQIEAYALLPNHFHLIVQQLCDDGVSEFIKRLLGGYTSYFNSKYTRSGALFQGTYKRIHIESDEYYNYLFSYVNENHFVHDIERPEDIIYSSSNHYQNKTKSALLDEFESDYDFKNSIRLAKDISQRRDILKTEV